ncbi:MAG: hypothetical protein GAK28_03327 [Luteibacter sp.]|uniref:hypothetical protein n=1 Tax=Luteibacter sp. TaxID=1886636 RepID=UPI00137F1436|nr:hypothetical protein [Luteibacter sp.]KAF1005294.1 MAG: hypothetical protein GAK28_03327 [Luteibacter sp.]
MPPAQLAIPLTLLLGALLALAMSPSSGGALRLPPQMVSAHLDDHPPMRMLRISIEPGASLPWRRDALPHAGYLVEGELWVVGRDGSETVIRPGDALAECMDVARRGSAGPTGATVIVFYTREA